MIKEPPIFGIEIQIGNSKRKLKNKNYALFMGPTNS
jgi:hypothetical protein